MLRAWLGRVKLRTFSVCALACLGLLAGCYWSRYAELMEIHLEVLDQFGAKLASVVQAKDGVPPEDWAEFVYPLERARDFARIAAQRYPDLGSLRAFRVVLERYGALLDDPADLSGPDAEGRLAERRAALAEAIAATREELRREADA